MSETEEDGDEQHAQGQGLVDTRHNTLKSWETHLQHTREEQTHLLMTDESLGLEKEVGEGQEDEETEVAGEEDVRPQASREKRVVVIGGN